MSAKDKQVGGDHYKQFAIQPIEFIQQNNLSYEEGNVIKYVTRHRFKNGKEDLEKAKHYIDLLIQKEYADVAEVGHAKRLADVLELGSVDCTDPTSDWHEVLFNIRKNITQLHPEQSAKFFIVNDVATVANVLRTVCKEVAQTHSVTSCIHHVDDNGNVYTAITIDSHIPRGKEC